MTDRDWGLVTRNNHPIPLTGVHVDGWITGLAAKVKVRQSYINREDKAIEAIYKFPLPEQASVCGFRVIIGEKILEGEIEERDKAFELYDKALERGDGAYILDLERPNLFTLSVGALPPRTAVVIEIEYITLLDATDNEVRFFLPTTISPRYVPANIPDKNGIPVDALVNPPISIDVPYGLRLALVIQGKEHIAGIESPSHTVATRYEDNHVAVELSSEETKMDRDFILTIRYREAFRNRAYSFRGKEGVFLQADLSPKKEQEPASVTNSADGHKEIIFVLDCSGSMEGSSIHEAKRALLILIKALREGTDFNIYRFGSTYEKLFQTSVSYSEENFQRAERYVKSISANLGGTEMLGPLADIYTTRPSGTRSIVLITDGEVGNEKNIFDLAKSDTGATRIFTIGIGHGPNEYLIKQLARASSGSSELVSPGERVEPKVLRLFGRITSASISDVKIHWPDNALQAPSAPAVYAGSTVSIFGKLKGHDNVPDTLRVTASVGGTPKEWILNVASSSEGSAAIPSLWARERIRDLEEGVSQSGSQQKQRKAMATRDEIVRLSKIYGIVSSQTSFLIIEKRLEGDRTTGEIVLRKVPAMLTKDWGGMLVTQADMAVPCIAFKEAAFYSRLSREPSTKFMDALASFDDSIELTYPRTALETMDDKLLYEILDSQKREGGFEANSAVLQLAGLSDGAFRNIVTKIRTAERTDLPVLLATAITLHFLRIRFANKHQEWEMVIEKSVRWLDEEIRRAKPTIEGLSLADWVMKNLP